MPTVRPEDLDRAALRERQTSRLRALVRALVPHNPFWTERFRQAGLDPATVAAPEDLARLPLLTKGDLVAAHEARPPYGTNLTYAPGAYVRMHQTSGTTGTPLRWLDTAAAWEWFLDCWAQIFRLAGIRDDDRFFFPFSFGPFVGFWAAFEGAARQGRLVLAGGGLSSEARLRMLTDNSATVVCCTPTYALRLVETAEQSGLDLAAGPVRALIVAGEPGGTIPATRARIEAGWGARVFDHWGMTEVGSLAAECAAAPGGMHVLESECLAEVVDPDTGRPVPAGTEGELVVTNLGRWGSPVLRYRTGDLVRLDTAECPCGRSLLRLAGGILGRCDDMVTIRGNNVHPSSLEAVLRGIAEVAEYRIEVSTRRAMKHLRIEVEPTAAAAADAFGLAAKVEKAVKDRLNFQAEIVAVAPGSLPRFEGKGRRFVRIEDG